jgi:hypothetical protein
MIKVTLPGAIEIACPACRERFTLKLRQLGGQAELGCPFCAARFNIYDGLTGQNRRKVYHAIRNDLEQRVYELQVKQGKVGF